MKANNGQASYSSGRTPNSRRLKLLLAMLAAGILVVPIRAEEPVPGIIDISYAANNVQLTLANLGTGGTYYVESTGNLGSNDWVEIDFFEGLNRSTNWSETLSGSDTAAFYRILRETYHPRVGQSATFGPPTAHLVSGTAHIVNNRTIKLRNFHYDGGGIEVKVYLSPDPISFNPYVAISDDLLGMAFTNATLVLDVPVGTDLNLYTNISIWCTHGFDFGSGPFQ